MIKIDITGLKKIASGLSKVQRKIHEDREKLVATSARHIQGQIRRSVTENLSKDATGKLRDSFDIVISKNDAFGIVSASVQSKLPYARIHEQGGIIKAKNPSGLLTVPIHPSAKLKRARDFPGIFRMGKVLAIKEGAGAKPTMLFALTPEVKMPARHYLTIALKRSEAAIKNLVGALMKGAIK